MDGRCGSGLAEAASALVFCFSSFEFSRSEFSVEFAALSAEFAFAAFLVSIGAAIGPRTAPQFIGDHHGFGNFPH